MTDKTPKKRSMTKVRLFKEFSAIIENDNVDTTMSIGSFMDVLKDEIVKEAISK